VLYGQTEDNLPTVYPPFLSAKLANSKEYTLILDLDETLVHYYETESEGHVLVRPGTEDFLVKMSQYYEIVIFTAALQDVLAITSMQTGCSIKLILINLFLFAYTGNMLPR
jgi:NLI interacting factor-like phosphatase